MQIFMKLKQVDCIQIEKCRDSIVVHLPTMMIYFSRPFIPGPQYSFCDKYIISGQQTTVHIVLKHFLRKFFISYETCRLLWNMNENITSKNTEKYLFLYDYFAMYRTTKCKFCYNFGSSTNKKKGHNLQSSVLCSKRSKFHYILIRAVHLIFWPSKAGVKAVQVYKE